MSKEQSLAKLPGQVAYEADLSLHTWKVPWPWDTLRESERYHWIVVENAVLEHYGIQRKT